MLFSIAVQYSRTAMHHHTTLCCRYSIPIRYLGTRVEETLMGLTIEQSIPQWLHRPLWYIGLVRDLQIRDMLFVTLSPLCASSLLSRDLTRMALLSLEDLLQY
jgi:hypothetical protein